MTDTVEPVATQTLREWARTHVEVVDERYWGPPPATVARIARQLVSLVARTHERGLVLPGLGPDSVLIGHADTVLVDLLARPGTAARREADLFELASMLCQLATGIEPLVRTHPAALAGQWAAVRRLLAEQAVGNPSAAALAPAVLGLLEPDPERRSDAAGLCLLLIGRPPRAGTAQVRLAG